CQTIKLLGAHAGPSFDDRAAVHEGMCWIVVDLLGMHRADDADVVGDFGDVRKQARNFLPGIAVFFEFSEWSASFQLGILELRELLALGERFGKRLAIDLLQLRLEIEAFQMRWSASHTQMDNSFRAYGKVRRSDDAFPMFFGFGCASTPENGWIEQ